MIPKRIRPRCMSCLGHGFFVTKEFNIMFTNEDNKYTLKLECVDCGNETDIEWEDY